MVMSTRAGTTAPGRAVALTHTQLQGKGAATAHVSGCLMSLPGAGDSSLTGRSCALVAVPSCWVKELQEEMSGLRSSQEEEQEMAGSSQRCCRAKDHPSPVLQRRKNLETTLAGAVDGDPHMRESWKPHFQQHKRAPFPPAALPLQSRYSALRKRRMATPPRNALIPAEPEPSIHTMKKRKMRVTRESLLWGTEALIDLETSTGLFLTRCPDPRYCSVTVIQNFKLDREVRKT